MEILEQTVKQRSEAFKAENPKARARDIAKGIGVSEAELLVLEIGKSVIRLDCNGPEILKRLP